MSWWLHLIIFLLSLPFAVWMLACICRLFDEPGNRSPALVQIVAVFCAAIAASLLVARELIWPMAAALGCVTVLHVGAYWLVRRFGLGVPIYETKPDNRVRSGNLE